MAKLMRMNIIGIRSFGPNDEDLQKIKFQSPLTLIQGQNGCGKTTIIEAIKFAITGELPSGTAKGQGFVYDPKLAKQFETRGQVRLRITDIRGECVTVSKSVCVTQKATKLEFKRLDSTISRGKKENHLSGKCADIDNAMCLSLGVSKPILNNVIFCHQEDSNWPLDEGKKLKEKFDDIFDSAKYNKCLTTTTKYLKQGNEKLKILKIELVGLLDKKKYIESKWETYREKQSKCEILNGEIEKYNAELQPINKKLEEIYEVELNYSKLCADYEYKKKDVQNLIQQQQEILKNITVFTGTDEELNTKISQFKKDFQLFQSDIDVLIAKKQDIEETEKNLRRKINEHQTKLGALQAEEKQNSIRMENRNKLIRKSINDLDLQIKFEDHTEDVRIKEIISDLNNKMKIKQQNVEALEKNMEYEEKLLQNEIDKIREEFAQLKQNIFLKNKNLSESKDELREIQNKISELNSAGDQLRISEMKLNRIEKDYKSLQASVDTDSLRAKIESEKRKQKDMENQLSIVDAEVQNLQQYTSLQTELDVKNENLLEKQSELQKLKNKHEKTLKHIFRDKIPHLDLKKEVETYYNTQNKLNKELTNQINDKQREVLKFESTLNNLQEKLNEKEKELTSSQNELSKYCEDRNLQDITEETKAHIDKLQNERGIYFSSKYLYQKFIKQFQSDSPCCPICKRGVEEKQYIATIISDLSKKIENVPNELLKLDNKLAQEQKKYQSLLELKPVNEKFQKLKQAVPVLKNQTNGMETNLKEATENLNKLKEDILQPQKNVNMAQLITGDITLMDQLQKELSRIKQEISKLTLRLPNNESNRGLQEALSEQDTLKIDIRQSRNNVESIQNKLAQHVDRLQKLKEDKNDLIAKQLNIKENLQGKDHLITKSTEIESKIVELENDIEQLKDQVESFKNNLETSMKRKETLKATNRSKMAESRTLINSLQKTIHSAQDFQKEIDDFHKKNVSCQIDTINETILSIKKDIEQYSTKKISIDKSVDELKEKITNSKIYFRELQDNIKLREKKEAQLNLQKDISELSKQLRDKDIEKIRKEKNKLMEKETSLQEAIHKAEGKKTELSDHIKELKGELDQPKNTQVALNYKKKFIEFKLHERGLTDLKTFIKAADWALMQFHKQKMIQINSIIKELWRTIYKGNDIDYIEIKTDNETTVGTDKRKVFNYRIVQVKNDAELDMRGRCSAGQRVLASLIIRISLAETFSSNCGILTLDEPTTNLDRENIISLSDALIELINQKRQQKNFQLIIITHDKDFVERLTRVESLDGYYIVQRNDQGKSVILETR